MINDVTDPMFSIVKPDNPVYFYTEDPTGSQGINRIVRDGSGRLWFYMCIGGVPVDESVVKVIAPVPQYDHTEEPKELTALEERRIIINYIRKRAVYVDSLKDEPDFDPDDLETIIECATELYSIANKIEAGKHRE